MDVVTVPAEVAEQAKTRWRNAEKQAEHELKLLERVPEMSEQHGDMRNAHKYARKCLAALEAGFDPYTPPRNWMMGFLSKPPRGVWPEGTDWNLYTRALPGRVIEAHSRATDLHLEVGMTKSGLFAKAVGIKEPIFKAITIHSADPSVFETVHEARPVALDPVMVGWVGNVPLRRQGGQDGFLIASWDIQTDLMASGLLLEAGTVE